MDFAGYAHFWILFSLLSAFFHASRLAVTKHLSFSFSAQALTLYVNLASLVVTLPLIIWYHDFPLHQPAYVGAVLCGGLLSGFGGWALNLAIQRGEISLVGPVLTLTPGFVVAMEWLLTGQLPSLSGALGLGLLMLGSYVVSLESGMRHWSDPLVMLVKNPGSLFTLAAALCFAAASTFGRVGIQLSDPLSFAVMVAAINPVMLYVIFSLQNRDFHREAFSPKVLQHGRSLLSLGVLFALMRIADQIALSLTLASYAMAVKRSAGLFAVVLGRWFFDEARLLVKLTGSAVMLLGLIVLTLM
ncbi:MULTISPECIES: EamA family transporter [Thiorhodovibrio]|uniref:EamA family transporter n=1 Tax=Thiorhodovibrio TaxID=61593 RepID=UPI001914B61F|nr:EamA family transporter [Thiorhodovibrio litoralis]MBK5970849.1 EamA family transporter [Thiorhodovibrio winogradskyi]WPL10759.1 phosphonate utilization associated putative membrane protein [Thiorhodovibrio litoralis]